MGLKASKEVRAGVHLSAANQLSCASVPRHGLLGLVTGCWKNEKFRAPSLVHRHIWAVPISWLALSWRVYTCVRKYKRVKVQRSPLNKWLYLSPAGRRGHFRLTTLPPGHWRMFPSKCPMLSGSIELAFPPLLWSVCPSPPLSSSSTVDFFYTKCWTIRCFGAFLDRLPYLTSAPSCTSNSSHAGSHEEIGILTAISPPQEKRPTVLGKTRVNGKHQHWRPSSQSESEMPREKRPWKAGSESGREGLGEWKQRLLPGEMKRLELWRPCSQWEHLKVRKWIPMLRPSFWRSQLAEKCEPDCWGGDPKSKVTDYEDLFVHPLFVYPRLDPGSSIEVMLYTGLDPEAAKASEKQGHASSAEPWERDRPWLPGPMEARVETEFPSWGGKRDIGQDVCEVNYELNNVWMWNWKTFTMVSWTIFYSLSITRILILRH